MVPEENALLRQTVDMGCFQVRVSHATEGVGSLVVREDENDVWPLVGPDERREDRENAEEKWEFHCHWSKR